MVNKRILFSIILLVAAVSLGAASTLAYFTDQQSTAANTITAGTLKLNDITNVHLTVANAIPDNTQKALGDAFTLQNVGTTAGSLTAIITNPTGADGFNKDLTIKIKDASGAYQTIYQNGVAATTPVVLSANMPNTGAGSSFSTDVVYIFAKEAVPQAQGGTFNFNIQFELKQA
jgi:predicted ribosomally synthesized peptide with SipW-like signal peptide